MLIKTKNLEARDSSGYFENEVLKMLTFHMYVNTDADFLNKLTLVTKKMFVNI